MRGKPRGLGQLGMECVRRKPEAVSVIKMPLLCA